MAAILQWQPADASNSIKYIFISSEKKSYTRAVELLHSAPTDFKLVKMASFFVQRKMKFTKSFIYCTVPVHISHRLLND